MQRWIVALGLLPVVAFAVWHRAPPAFTTSTASEPAPSARPRAEIRRAHRPAEAGAALVYVVGAVARPGLYRVAADARVDDAVRAAGGLRADADPAGINLAARANDGDEIAVPLLGQPTQGRGNTKRTRTPRSRTAKKIPEIVDVNTASAQALASVPGIGAMIAARIVQVRKEEGAFTSYDELLDVAGMTDSRLARAQPYLRL
jgi:competence protein ComEA